MELALWRKSLWKSKERFHNAHLVPFYTTFFGLDQAFYAGKRILDAGCGPVGRVEWAPEALERIGLDPLADSYMKFNRGRHQMRYVAAPSENIPFPNDRFDVVTAFNALDHVEDVDRTIGEFKSVCAPGGTIPLIVEIRRPSPNCTCWVWTSSTDSTGFRSREARCSGFGTTTTSTAA